MRLLFVVVLVLVFLGSAVYFFSNYLKSGSDFLNKRRSEYSIRMGFVLEEVYIEGCNMITPSDVMRSANIKNGDSIFIKSPWTIKKDIEKLPWVRGVLVDRQLPNKLYVGIRERKPIAIKQYNKKLQLIDEDGQVFSVEQISGFSNLPIFVGMDVEDHVLFVMSYIKRDQAIFDKIDSVQRVGDRRWDVVFKDKFTIKLPEVGEEQAWERFINMYNRKDVDFTMVKTIDLRVEKKVFIEKRVN